MKRKSLSTTDASEVYTETPRRCATPQGACAALSAHLSISQNWPLARRQLSDSREQLELTVALRTAELQEKEARLRTIFETSFTYQGLMRLDGVLIAANATSLAGIDAALEDVLGKPFWETPWFIDTPGMPECVRDAIPDVAKGAILRREIHIRLPSSGWRWFDFQMRAGARRSRPGGRDRT